MMWLSGSSVGNTAGSISSREIGSTLELLEVSFFSFLLLVLFFFFRSFFPDCFRSSSSPVFTVFCSLCTQDQKWRGRFAVTTPATRNTLEQAAYGILNLYFYASEG